MFNAQFIVGRILVLPSRAVLENSNASFRSNSRSVRQAGQGESAWARGAKERGRDARAGEEGGQGAERREGGGEIRMEERRKGTELVLVVSVNCRILVKCM